MMIMTKVDSDDDGCNKDYVDSQIHTKYKMTIDEYDVKTFTVYSCSFVCKVSITFDRDYNEDDNNNDIYLLNW